MDNGMTLTITADGKSTVKHRKLPMTPSDKQRMIAEFKTKGTVYWDGQEM
jgi:hypothetical protein